MSSSTPRHPRPAPARDSSRARLYAVAAALWLLGAGSMGCSSISRVRANDTATAQSAAKTQQAQAQQDENACASICEASTACGDERSVCEPKCRDWLVKRGRPGIARAAAACAIPRIGAACDHEWSTRSAATALVFCIDEVGQVALNKDRASLLVAARAICEHGARCSDASSMDADRCVSRIALGRRAPRGLGVFGAFKPEFVRRFALCMKASSCSGDDDEAASSPGGQSSGAPSGPAECFAEMLGQPGSGLAAPGPDAEPTPDDQDETSSPAQKI